MTEPRPDDAVHQAFFGWSHDAGKLAVFSHSFPRMEEATRWLRRLEAHLRLQPVPGADPPLQALSCLYYEDGFVAVLRRINTGYSPGRNSSHALIGPATALGMPIALGLGNWSGWQDTPAPGEMETFSATYFLPAQALAAEQLRPLVQRCEHELGVVLARLLDHPHDPLSIIGCPDEDRLAMVWGLRAAADDYLRQQGCNRFWSFSTYEDRHDVTIEELPEIVFLPVKPEGAAVVRRTIVELDHDLPLTPNATLAVEFVTRLLREPVVAHAGAHDNVPLIAQTAPAQPRVEQRHPTYGSGAPGEAQRRDGIGRHGQQRQSQQTAPADREPVAALLGAESVREFEAELRGLEASAQWPQHRTMLRATLDIGAMNTVTRFVEISAREELLERLLRLVYGPLLEDLDEPDALKHATKLVKDGQSDQLAMILGGAGAAAHRVKPKIRDAAFERWAAAGRATTPTPTGRIAKAYRSARRSDYLPYVAVIAAAALLMAMFLLGFLAGRPVKAQPAAAPSAGPTTPSTVQSPALSAVGQVTISPDPSGDQQVWSFVRVGNSYYPQARCIPVESAIWRCTKHKDPPSAGQWVAIVVPQGDAQSLQTVAEKDKAEAVSRGKNWRPEDVPVFS